MHATLIFSPSLFLLSFPLSPCRSSSPFLSPPLSFLLLGRAHSSRLISHEPLLIVWLQSPHAAAMVTGRVYCCSECKFNTTFDDISRMKCERMCLWVCVRMWESLIYLSDLHPPLIVSENRDTVKLYVSFGVSGLFERSFFNRRLSLWLCIFHQTSLRSGGCPCFCQSNLLWQTQRDAW